MIVEIAHIGIYIPYKNCANYAMRALTSLAEQYDEEIASLAPEKVIKQIILQLQSSCEDRVRYAVNCLSSFFVSEDSLIVDNAINFGFFTHVVNIF